MGPWNHTPKPAVIAIVPKVTHDKKGTVRNTNGAHGHGIVSLRWVSLQIGLREPLPIQHRDSIYDLNSRPAHREYARNEYYGAIFRPLKRDKVPNLWIIADIRPCRDKKDGTVMNGGLHGGGGHPYWTDA